MCFVSMVFEIRSLGACIQPCHCALSTLHTFYHILPRSEKKIPLRWTFFLHLARANSNFCIIAATQSAFCATDKRCIKNTGSGINAPGEGFYLICSKPFWGVMCINRKEECRNCHNF